jgi:small-conductance mechanosensitive channel
MVLDILELQFGGQPAWQWLLAIAVTLATWIVVRVSLRVGLRRLQSLSGRTSTGIDDLIVSVLGKTRGFFVAVVAINIGARSLVLPAVVDRGLYVLLVLTTAVQLAGWGTAAIMGLFRMRGARQAETDAAAVTTLAALNFVVRLVFYVLLLLLTLDNLGVNVSALVAGLGIGGVAIALAVQNILGDLFGSLSIVLDKPFLVGDFIIVGDLLGTVEHVGLKTTRVRSLYGEQLIFANSDLLSSRIRNYKRMAERRVTFTFRLAYQTPLDKVERTGAMVEEIIRSLDLTRFDRAHFRSLDESALTFEVVYYVLSPDYNPYMDIQQRINLMIMRRFAEEGILFAYPTQTIIVAKPDGGEPPAFPVAA